MYTFIHDCDTSFFIQFVNAILRQRCGFTYNNGFIALSFEPNTLFETSIVSSKILKTSSQKPDKKYSTLALLVMLVTNITCLEQCHLFEAVKD